MRCDLHCPSPSSSVLPAATVAAAVAGLVVLLDHVMVYLLIGAAAFAVVMVPVLAWLVRAGHGTPPWLQEQAPPQVTLRAAPVRRASLEAPRRELPAAPRPGVTVTLSARDYVAGAAATVPRSPARRTAGTREWQQRR